MKLYIHKLGDGAQAHYRATLPARHCHGPDLDITCATHLDHYQYDAVMFPRLISPTFMPALERIKNLGVKVIWELDDDLWHIPEHNPASHAYTTDALERIQKTAKLADSIVVSTKPLAEMVKEKTGRTATVLPNLIDLDEWPEPQPRQPGPIKILWAGSHHHKADIEILVDPLERIIHEFKDKVQVLFWGDHPGQLATLEKIKYTHLSRIVPKSKHVGFVEPVPLDQYPRTLVALQPDIGLAPLTVELFNRSKSNLKWMEYSMAGAATIATPLPPYLHITACWAEWFEASGWHAQLKEMVENQDYRQRLAEEAREQVIREFSWQHSPHKQRWIDFFQGRQCSPSNTQAAQATSCTASQSSSASSPRTASVALPPSTSTRT